MEMARSEGTHREFSAVASDFGSIECINLEVYIISEFAKAESTAAIYTQ
jgi:hypothetical protein